MYSHVIIVMTHLNVKLPAIGGHPPNADADSHLPVITDSSNKCRVFGGHFNPKSLAARTLGCDRQFPQIPMLPSGDRKPYFFGYISFTTSRRKSHVCCVKTAMSNKRTILSFDQCASCRALAIEMVRKNANSTYRSKQSGHKEPSRPSGIRAAGYVERQKLCGLQVFV